MATGGWLTGHSLKCRKTLSTCWTTADLMVCPLVLRRRELREAAKEHGGCRDVLARSLEDGRLAGISDDASMDVLGIRLGTTSVAPNTELALKGVLPVLSVQPGIPKNLALGLD